MAGRPKRRARLARENRARKNSDPVKTGTYAQLLAALKKIGPSVVTAMVLAGTTKQCSSMSQEVAGYLQELGFIARKDVGAGIYGGHYDLGVYTSDRGWISVDPTFIQFHCPISMSAAYSYAVEQLGVPHFRGGEDRKLALTARSFEPTIQWSLAALKDGLKAFELGEITSYKPKVSADVGKPPWSSATWEEHWSRLQKNTKDLKEGKLESYIYPAASGYWAQEIARRMQPTLTPTRSER